MSAANTTEKGELSSHIATWTKDKASADLLGLEWAALQGQYYKMEDNIKYVTKGSIIACDNGTLFSRIDLPIDHGVEVKSNHLPIMTTEDFGSQNIPLFGICKKRTTSEVTYHCSPAINNQWIQNANTTAANKAALLQADAFAVCAFGGIICVKEVNKTPQESFMVILREQYGFDERAAKIILVLYKAIQDKYTDESQIAKDWRFTRLLGGFRYALKGKEKATEIQLWNQTAGDWHIESLKEGASNKKHSKTLKEYMMSDLGLSGEDYEYLQYKVRIQNFLVGKDENTIKYNEEKVNSGLVTYNSDYLKSMQKGVGKELKVSEFLKIWNQQCEDMCGKADFAHQQATTSAILVTEIDKNGWVANAYLGGDRRRERMAGWLGDATLGNPPSFGKDDYMADLDAENIGYMVKNGGGSYIEAVEDYYGRCLLESNRAKFFLEDNDLKDNDLEDIKWAIYDGTVFLDLVDKKSYTNDFEEIMKLEKLYKYEDGSWLKILKDIAPGSYNFIRSLEASTPEMGEYK